MKEFRKYCGKVLFAILMICGASLVILQLASVSNETIVVKPDTTIKKYIDEEADMMCYYTDTWGSCFYVLKD